MGERLELTAQRSVAALTNQTEALHARLNATVGETLGALSSHSDAMSERLETTAQSTATAFTNQTEALHARLNATVGETLGALSSHSDAMSDRLETTRKFQRRRLRTRPKRSTPA